ncbi:MAG: SDR family NAD(P)-dependent oxidoreductase [Novosphingobium sp.]
MNELSQQRVAVVTGASAGIGKAAAKALAATGWHVIGVGRDPARTAAAEAEIRAAAAQGGRVDMIRADLSSLADTSRTAEEIVALTNRLDALLNNAGGVVAEREVTPEGHEATLAGNHLAPFLLTRKLMPLLEATAARTGPGAVRVVGVSSSAHEHCPAIRWDDLAYAQSYNGSAAYCHAKLANLLFTHELAKRVAAHGIVAHAMHPGVVASNFASHCDPGMQAYMESIKDRSMSPEQAADTLVWLATAEEPGRSTGRYWHQRELVAPSAAATDDAEARRLWDVSEQLVAGAEGSVAGVPATA